MVKGEYSVKFTKEELGNLLIFLQRIQLKGEEANEYIKLTNKINQAIPTERDVVEEKEK